MPNQLQKAYLETETGTRIDCMFNPTTFAFARKNRWESDQIPGKDEPSLRYAGGVAGSFSLSLVFDTTDTGDPVTKHTNKILGLMQVDPSLPGYDAAKNNGRPPWVKFHWGTEVHSFKSVITSTNVTFTYFSNEGLPLRANVEISLEQFEADASWGPQNPTSRTPKPQRTHQVQVGDTLDRIAARYHGDSTKWRDIATLNGISDPLDLTPGRLLAIPNGGDEMVVSVQVPEIKIDGQRLEVLDPDVYAVNLHVSRTSGAAASAQLWIDMTETDGDAIQIGASLDIGVVSLEADADSASIFTGSVTSIGIEVESRRTQLIIGAHDASYPLGQTTISTSRLNMSAKAIVTSIAQDFGLTVDIDSELGAETLLHVQETGTAHEFITDIARTFGCEWFVEGTKLVVRPRKSSAPIKIRGDEELRRFSARFSAIEQATSMSVRRWDADTKDVVTAKQDLADGALLAESEVPIATRGRAWSTAEHGPGAGVALAGLATGVVKPETQAAGVMGRHESSMLTGRGEVDVRAELMPGVRIELEEVKTEWNGIYYVTAVEHVFGEGRPFTSRFTIGGLEPTTMVDLLGPSPARSRDRLATSLAIGIVTDNEDPDALDRVKIRIPALSDDNESWWARLVQSGAGAARGWVVVPEVDDEVVVAFEHGDIQRPFVLGGLWNGQDAPPAIDGLINNGTVQSRSFTSRLGHRIEFRDGAGDDQQFVEVKLDNSTTKLYLGADKIELHSADKAIQIKTNDATIDLTEQGDIKLDAKNIELHAAQKIDLKSDSGDITIDSGMNANVKGKMNALVDGKAGATLQSSAVAAVKGITVNLN